MGEEAKAAPGETSYIVKSSVRDYLRNANKRVDADVFDTINKAVVDILRKAVDRAEKNKRATVRPEDI